MTKYKDIESELLSEFQKLTYFAPLPSERELAQKFSASRPTIRRALENMALEGSIVKIQGKGSFFMGNKIPVDYANFQNEGLGLFQALRSAGNVTRSQVLQQVAKIPKSAVQKKLGLQANEMVFHLQRLRFVNDSLYSFTDDYIPLKVCPSLMETDFSKASLMTTLKDNQVFPHREEKTIEIKKAGLQEATYLNLANDAPISLTKVLTYDKDGRIIQYGLSRADAYKSRFHFTSILED